ncbi:hypothetical protein KP509_1Z273100 [Ceratopteris richardii]|nr:hypothetical protein KP509_1Z273100 [Ceratopteris richardii]
MLTVSKAVFLTEIRGLLTMNRARRLAFHCLGMKYNDAINFNCHTVSSNLKVVKYNLGDFLSWPFRAFYDAFTASVNTQVDALSSGFLMKRCISTGLPRTSLIGQGTYMMTPYRVEPSYPFFIHSYHTTNCVCRLLSSDDSDDSDDSDSDSESVRKKKKSLLRSFGRALVTKVLSNIEPSKKQPNGRSLYVLEVLELLENNKQKIMSMTEKTEKEEACKEIQLEIEKKTMLFDEKSIYKTSRSLFEMLTMDPITYEQRATNMRNNLFVKCQGDYYINNVLSHLNVYTLEVLVIYALGQIFNNYSAENPLVKAVTLVEKLGRIVLKDSVLPSTKGQKFEELLEVNLDEKVALLGGCILNILIEKRILALYDSDVLSTPSVRGKASHKDYKYVKCLYDLSHLPVKLNLPMIAKPNDWKIDMEPAVLGTSNDMVPVLRGGYYTSGADVYYRYRLISSKNPELFKLQMTVREGKETYLKAMSFLQSVRFVVDNNVLEFIHLYWDRLTDLGLLSNSSLIDVNPESFVFELRKHVKAHYSELFKEFLVEAHKARNEKLIFTMAKAFSGYDIYFPAFQDFRGRIYRTGIFQLHGCDLYRSLLKFGSSGPTSTRKLSLSEIPAAIKTATAKLYDSSFESDSIAINWFDQWYLAGRDNNHIDDYIIDSMNLAKEPFQFLRKALLILKESGSLESEPVFMDASSSAYQIMAYLLQDVSIAKQTNLIPGIKRNDLYMSLREDFMNDKIPYKLSMTLGKEAYKYWCLRYSGLHNLLKLFGSVGYLCASLGIPDYRKFEKQSVWIYSRDRLNKRRRHKISFNVLTKKANAMKSKCATLANFIHQKDALIAINTISHIMKNYPQAPLYTVHDCFVSNYAMAEKLADIYKETFFFSLGHPLSSPRYPHYMSSSAKLSSKPLTLPQIPEKSLTYLCMSDPIPLPHLEIFVRECIESRSKEFGLTKTKKLLGISYEIIEFYQKYVESLSALDKLQVGISTRMKQFQSLCFDQTNGKKKNYSLT